MPWMITHLPDPPWHLLSVAASKDASRPYGKLALVQLSVVAMQCMKEAAGYEELRRKYGAAPYGDGTEGDALGSIGRQGDPKPHGKASPPKAPLPNYLAGRRPAAAEAPACLRLAAARKSMSLPKQLPRER